MGSNIFSRAKRPSAGECADAIATTLKIYRENKRISDYAMKYNFAAVFAHTHSNSHPSAMRLILVEPGVGSWNGGHNRKRPPDRTAGKVDHTIIHKSLPSTVKRLSCDSHQ